MMYYTGQFEFASITSLLSAKWVEVEDYGITLLSNGIIVICLITLIIILNFITKKTKNVTRKTYLLALVSLIIPMITFIKMSFFREDFEDYFEYSQSIEYIYDNRSTPTEFVKLYGYFYYRQADLIAVIRGE